MANSRLQSIVSSSTNSGHAFHLIHTYMRIPVQSRTGRSCTITDFNQRCYNNNNYIYIYMLVIRFATTELCFMKKRRLLLLRVRATQRYSFLKILRVCWLVCGFYCRAKDFGRMFRTPLPCALLVIVCCGCWGLLWGSGHLHKRRGVELTSNYNIFYSVTIKITIVYM